MSILCLAGQSISHQCFLATLENYYQNKKFSIRMGHSILPNRPLFQNLKEIPNRAARHRQTIFPRFGAKNNPPDDIRGAFSIGGKISSLDILQMFHWRRKFALRWSFIKIVRYPFGPKVASNSKNQASCSGGEYCSWTSFDPY